MAFNIQGLGKIGNQSRRGKSAQLYTYRTTDTLATITANNYFLPIADQLEVGDTIEVQHVVDLAASPVAITGTNKVFIGAKIPGFILAAGADGVAVLTTKIDDVSTASFAEITSNVAGTIGGITAVLGGAIATANDTIAITIGGVAVTNGNITVTQVGSGPGSVFNSTPTAANVLAVGNALRATTNGASDNTVPLYVIYKVTL
ncbi:hypothetical protein [Candidatus Odyssella acanthamoebae]|uniref:Uncharacterized protein n=1 Tax=Candidatus Odyssella acanthamoebae TaxID=91604 RepID=A0A077AYX8_9PROT|nr:hypothetical protein [Candidatus Paracaedibacter acanthamoebae]AIK95915.1 hypothetical protein ID47_02955 [Candidatus Paracaedibacter acanthamoebae]